MAAQNLTHPQIRSTQKSTGITQRAKVWPYDLEDGAHVIRILHQAAVGCRSVNPRESRRLSCLASRMSLDGGLPREMRLRKWQKMLSAMKPKTQTKQRSGGQR